MNHGSLFSGIGGFDLAAEWMEWENKFHCEWNEFGQRVLKYYWPKAKSYEDITKTDFTIWRGRINVLTGGFPCQPYSSAGKRKGKEDERHLWPEMLRAIREIRPRWVVGENVLGLVNWNGGLVFEEVQADLEAEGYEVQPFILPAASVNAPHRRDRVWFVAYANGTNEGNYGRENTGASKEVRRKKEGDVLTEFRGNGDVANSKGRRSGRIRIQAEATGAQESNKSFGSVRGISNVTDSDSKRWQERNDARFTKEQKRQFNQEIPPLKNWQDFPTQPPVCSGNDGLPTELDGITFPKWRNESIKGYGNAVVPQVVYQIFKAIEQYEKNSSKPRKGIKKSG